VLAYDMVFVPQYRFDGELLGIAESVPRAVPTEAVVAGLSALVPADVLQKVLLFLTFPLAVVGAARLLPSELPSAARMGAGFLYAWNPFVYERMLIGHWSLLLAYAALPWVARAAVDVRNARSRALPRLGLWLAVASAATPYGGILATGIATAVVGAPPWHRRVRAAGQAGIALGLGLVANLPWLAPALLRPGGLPSGAGGLEAFAARSDSPLGTIGSVITLGGMWNTDLAPTARDTVAWLPLFAVITGLALWGWRALAREWPAWRSVALLGAASVGLVLAVAPAVPGLDAAHRVLGLHLPGGGILRDSQKFVAPLALALALGFGTGIARAVQRAGAGRRNGLARRATALLAVLPLALVPVLAWGAAGRLSSVAYPSSWDRARAAMAADSDSGRVLVLPWHLYLVFPWNPETVLLNPAQRYFSRPALTTQRIELRSRTLPSEDPLARRADGVVLGDGPLAPALPGLGVRYVLVLKLSDWERHLSRLDGLEPVLEEPDLLLLRSTAPVREVPVATPPAGVIVAVDLVVVAAIAGLAVRAVRGGRCRGAAGRALLLWRRPPGGRERG
jgi:hypothetical protein